MVDKGQMVSSWAVSMRDEDAPVTPRVCVMIPTYNQSRFLRDAVESALRQDYPNLEIIICDDASKDDMRDVVSDLLDDNNVRYFRNPTNLGRVGNYRHILYDLASGEWVINLDGDDCFISRTYISNAVRMALSDPQIVLVIGKAAMGSSLGGDLLPLNAGISKPHVMDGTDFFFQYPPFETIAPLHATCLYHRASALEIGFYEKDIRSSDFDSLYRLMIGRKVGLLDETAALWRQHGANTSASASLDDLIQNIQVFEGPYQRAKELRCRSEAKLGQWRRQRLARYLLSSLTQTVRGRIPLAVFLRLAGFLCKRDPLLVTSVPTMLMRAIRDRRQGGLQP